MKKYLLIGLLFIPFLSFSSSVFELSTSSSPFLSVTSEGRFGLGTSSPLSKFELSLNNDDKGFYVYSGSSPTQNVFQILTNLGRNVFSVDRYGRFQIRPFTEDQDIFTVSSASGLQMYKVGSRLNTDPALTLKGNGNVSALVLRAGSDTQTANIQTWTTSTSTILSVVSKDGSFGIGTSSPSQKLSVAGNVLADGYIEYSPIYIGDALSQIKNIKPEIASLKSDSSWAKIDHLSLPDGVRYEQNIIWPAVYATKIIDVLDSRGSTTTEEIIDYKKLISATSTELFIGRDLGKQVQFNLRAIQQLLEKVEFLEAKIRLLEAQK